MSTSMTFSEGVAYSDKALAELKAREAEYSKFKMMETSTLADPSADLVMSLVGFPTAAGKIVTKETALRVIAFLSGVRMLSNDIAKLPLILHESKIEAGRQTILPALENPLYPILKDCPNRWQTSFELRFFLVSQLVMAGNCFAQVIRNGRGEVLELIPLNAWHMHAEWNLDVPGKPVLFWRYGDSHGNIKVFQAEDLLRVTALNVEATGIMGSRTTVLAKEALSVLMAAEEQAGRQFANGLSMAGFITSPEESEMDQVQAQNVVDNLKRNFAGSQNAAKFTFLPGGLKWEKMSFNAQESQLLESRKFSEEQIARLLGGAPLMVKMGLGEKNSTFAASSAFLQEYFSTSLLPYCTAIEQAITRDLILPKDRATTYARHDATVVLRGSLRERAETYQIQLISGQLSPNDVAVLEHRNTVPGFGDVRFFPANSGYYDPATGEYAIPGQAVPEPNPDEQNKPDDGTREPDDDDEGEDAPPNKPPKKGKPKAEGRVIYRLERLQAVAKAAAERVIRKEQKAGTADVKFTAEVLSIPMEKAEEYVSKRKALSEAEARAALVALAQGD
jgi:HK97 family phage portal protein